jgi:hypothetical protein
MCRGGGRRGGEGLARTTYRAGACLAARARTRRRVRRQRFASETVFFSAMRS